MNNFNLIAYARAGWSAAYDMPCVLFEHDVTFVRVGVCGQRFYYV